MNVCNLVAYKTYISAGDDKLFSCFCLVCSLSSSSKHASAMFCLGKKGQGRFLYKQTDLCSFFLCRMKNNYFIWLLLVCIVQYHLSLLIHWKHHKIQSLLASLVFFSEKCSWSQQSIVLKEWENNFETAIKWACYWNQWKPVHTWSSDGKVWCMKGCGNINDLNAVF